jgi:hypothetical protein
LFHLLVVKIGGGADETQIVLTGEDQDIVRALFALGTHNLFFLGLVDGGVGGRLVQISLFIHYSNLNRLIIPLTASMQRSRLHYTKIVCNHHFPRLSFQGESSSQCLSGT